MATIPVIDISPLRHHDPTGHQRVAAELHEVCSRIGFFYVSHHGVDQDLIDRTFAQVQRFFAQPLTRKTAIAMANSPIFRGYSGLAEEVLNPALEGDLKESFNIGVERGPGDPLVQAGTPLHGPNLWPDGLPGFRETMEDYFQAMTDLGQTIARGLALSLDLPAAYFSRSLDDPMSLLRLLHYPPTAQRQSERQMGAGAHTDYGCVTLLAQDEIGGLEVRNTDGQWLLAPPIPGTFVINLGDQMARWTNGRYQSTPHRVFNASDSHRYSIPFFFDPNFNALIECIATCLAPGETPKYPPILAGQHIINRYDETYLDYEHGLAADYGAPNRPPGVVDNP